MKRKRNDAHGAHDRPASPAQSDTHPVLQRFYPQVLRLRQFLLSRLAHASTRKRRRIAQLGHLCERPAAPGAGAVAHDDLRRLLDNTWVGCAQQTAPTVQADLEKELVDFSQQLPASSNESDICHELQSEIVDFVIRSLFRKHPGQNRPPHVLCNGFERASRPDHHNALQPEAPSSLSGVLPRNPNSHVEVVKGPAWSALLIALGHGGDRIMIELLMNCGIFATLDGPSGTYYQLSGKPLANLTAVSPHQGLQNKFAENELATPAAQPSKPRNKGPGSLTAITFVRSRMLYARAALNAKGEVCFGLRHIHVLNRLSDHTSLKQTVHVLKYMFPRQFGLHNVFTSKTDYRETSQPFQDYTLREKEIAYDRLRKVSRKGRYVSNTSDVKDVIPKRLRSHVVDLVRRLRVLHHRCSYVELLRYHCPASSPDDRGVLSNDNQHLVPSTTRKYTKSDAAESFATKALKDTVPLQTGMDGECFTDLASSEHQVSAFCRAVMSRVIPNRLWGEGEGGMHNKQVFMRHVDRFVCLRRFESLTLHEVVQDMKITCMTWLHPSNVRPGSKMSQTDFNKRRELLAELMYYLFDSFLILLIRTNFHVTESNVDRNRLYYFRHDVWRKLTEPALTHLKTTMFEEMNTDKASGLLATRSLGYSQVRLLPKKSGARPITNLRKRLPITINGRTVLGRSINSVMKPVFNVLNYEKSMQPHRLGSSLFSVGDMYPRLKMFRSSLQQRGLIEKPFYFVKVDVRSCFDAIPQKQLLKIIKELLRLEQYRVTKHFEVNTVVPSMYSKSVASSVKPIKRYMSRARAADDLNTFESFLRAEMGAKSSNTVFVDSAIEQQQSRSEVLNLLTEHVERNIVKFGKKFYRQKTGIAQGSVLSSLLCNFFYADLEANLLSFLTNDSSVLLRLIDDSLLITTEREHAERFLQIMYEGDEDYGISIKKEKTLVNFSCQVDGTPVPRTAPQAAFPYCGTLIHTGNLNISKDFPKKDQRQLRDSLTVEFSKLPGQTFHRKTLNALKIQLHGMFLDTSFNDKLTVLRNLHGCFVDTARKSFEYVKSLAGRKRTSDGLLIKTVDDVVALASGMMRRKKARGKAAAWADYGCEVTRRHTRWLCCHAFHSVFQHKQTKHAVLLQWLAVSMEAWKPCARRVGEELTQAVSA